jgi:hypothetical protein
MSARDMTIDNPALLRLKNEIAKDRARLSERLEEMGLADRTAAPSHDVMTGRLYRVFSLMSEG